MVTHLRIGGMRSVHAVRAVRTALAGVDGISRAEVRLGAATVEHDGRATPERLAAAVALAGCEMTEWHEGRGELPLWRPTSDE